MPELQLLPEKTTKVQFKTQRRLGPGILFLAITLVLSGGLLFYNQSLEKKVQKLDAQFLALNQARDLNKESRVTGIKSKLSRSQTLLDEHILWSKGFKKVQNLTLPSVQFQSLVASIPELKFEFKAAAPNLATIAKQGANFLTDDSVTDLAIGQIKVLTSGQTEFVVKLTFDRDKFLK